MDLNLRKNIIKMLEDYQKSKQQIALLRYEIAHPQEISHREMMESMIFARGEGNARMPQGYVSDKTYYIAMNYQDKADALNRERNTTLSEQLLHLERRVDRLKHSVYQLSSERGAVIRGIYFDGKGYKELAAELHLSERTIQRYKEVAIDDLTMMYEVLYNAGVAFE